MKPGRDAPVRLPFDRERMDALWRTDGEALMALLLIGLITIGLVASLFLREVRVFLLLLIAAIAGVILLYVAVDVARSFRDIHRENVAMSRIPAADVFVDDLQLTGTSAAGYRLGGTVHNHNASYALTD